MTTTETKHVGTHWIKDEQIMSLRPTSDISDHLKDLEDYIDTAFETVRIYYPETIKSQSEDTEVNETTRYGLTELYRLCKDCKFLIIID